ncbi:hypothetical protein GN244_ATG07414 [Phytophthora infestans]|uniref:Uncharacterized protein n=1 Tax=Phytophthora infestans TaxID=4787 RepID=A0A833SZZ1_PHYIN|nr:hypothetical protein GN244_ATG07414 [Phytophthora infestans]
MTQPPSETMEGKGGGSRQEGFTGELEWCDGCAMWARTTGTARLRRRGASELLSDGEYNGMHMAVHEPVCDGYMRWKDKAADTWYWWPVRHR